MGVLEIGLSQELISTYLSINDRKNTYFWAQYLLSVHLIAFIYLFLTLLLEQEITVI